MKPVININFQGRVVPIEESAYDILKQYVESLRRYFATEEGRDEIINDIEGRIAELFGETLKKGVTCITDDDVNKIIDSMGRPEDFEGEEANVKSQLGGNEQQQQQQHQQQQTYTQPEGAKRLYRDENNKVLGGVASGVANYFGFDPLIARILFVVFFGVMFIPYLILWIAVPGTSSVVIGSQRKRLFRDPDDKVIAGVCSGLSQYFGVSIWIPRLLFLIPFFSFVFRFGNFEPFGFPNFLSFSFSPGSLFIYIILWLVLPEAKTAADKLEMKGEKVDLNTIKNTIQGDMEGFGKRAQKFGEELGEKAKEFGQTVGEKGAAFSTEAATTVRKHRSSIGDVILLIIKIFAYFIIGSILIGLVFGLFGMGIVFTGFIPTWSYVIADGWQSVFAWGTLILFIWVPVIGIVTFIIRRLTKSKGNSNVIRWGFGALWTLGWVCLTFLLASLSKDFKYRNTPGEETIKLSNPGINKLKVKIEPFGKFYRSNWFRLEPFASYDEDTVFVRNINIQLTQSADSNFHVKMVKLSNGRTRQQANELAANIDFTINQEDTALILTKGIAIDRINKFRNQHVVITIAVPKGKMIYVDEKAGWDHDVRVNFGSDDWDWWESENSDKLMRGWRHNRWYKMGDGKLERIDNKKDWDDDYENEYDRNEKLKRYEKSREEIQKELEETQRKAEELKNALDKPVITDSTRYKYKPSNQRDTSRKNRATVKTQTPVGMSDLLMMRFPI